MIEAESVQVESTVVIGKINDKERKGRREFDRLRQKLKQSLKTKR